MKAVHIKENQREVWNRIVAENGSESFLQAWEWGEFNRALGRKVWRIGIIEDSSFGESKTKESRTKNHELKIKLLGAVLIVKYDLPLGKSYLYCPRMMNHESRTVDFLLEEIKNIAEKENSLFLRFDPAVITNHESRITNHEFKKCFNNYNFKKAPDEIQPRDTLILDLAKSEEELLRDMKSKTRYNIRLAGRKGVEIRKLEPPLNPPLLRGGERQNPLLAKEGAGGGLKKGFEEFWRLTEETSRRDNFRSHDKNYYWRMLESLGGGENVRWFHSVRPAGGPVEPECEFAKRFHSPDRTMEPAIPTPNPPRERNNLTAKLYLAEYNKKIIAANIVLFFGDYCVYLHGASSNKYRNMMAPYLLQWRQILDAKKMGCKKYDFWGISPAGKDSVEPPPAPSLLRRGKYKIPSLRKRGKNDWGGITRFKKGFGGKEVNYVGAYDMVFDKVWYGIYRVAKKGRSYIVKLFLWNDLF